MSCCRAATAKQLLEPLYHLLTQVNGQLAQGQPWSAMAGWADVQLTSQLNKVRVVVGVAASYTDAASTSTTHTRHLMPPAATPPVSACIAGDGCDMLRGPWLARTWRLACSWML